jgi:hypothetical protein
MDRKCSVPEKMFANFQRFGGDGIIDRLSCAGDLRRDSMNATSGTASAMLRLWLNSIGPPSAPELYGVLSSAITKAVSGYWVVRIRECYHQLGGYFFLRVFSLLLLALFWPLFRCNGGKKVPSKADIPFQALLTVLTPTCSIWPPFYLALVHRARYSKPKSIILPLFKLMDDIYSGQIELRDPQNDLPGLLRDHLCVDACFFRLEIEATSRVAVLRWLLLSDLPTLKACSLLLISSN